MTPLDALFGVLAFAAVVPLLAAAVYAISLGANRGKAGVWLALSATAAAGAVLLDPVATKAALAAGRTAYDTYGAEITGGEAWIQVANAAMISSFALRAASGALFLAAVLAQARKEGDPS